LDRPPHPDLEQLMALAEIVARWVDDVPGVTRVYIFGSRVRGDNRPDSDVDIRLFTERLGNDGATAHWWTQQNENCFSELDRLLPGPIEMHLDSPEVCDPAISEGERNIVLTVRKVSCVWISRKPGSAADFAKSPVGFRSAVFCVGTCRDRDWRHGKDLANALQQMWDGNWGRLK
jgi:Nucleotidyltransferase domain